jgi:predicted N-acetyltransferase YhbS
VHVRPAESRDSARLVDVINAAFAVETFFEGTRTDAERLARTMTEGEFFVAEDERGNIVGCIYVEREGDRGYFGMLSVIPALQGRGIGRALVQAAEKWARAQGCSAMDIWVLNLRTELPPLYRALGYRETGTTDFHPSRPLKPGFTAHCIVMSKQL